MGVFARFDVGHHFAHVDTVFPHGIAHGHVAERYFVANWDVLKGLNRDGPVFVHDPTGHGCSCFEAFDYHHCDGIFGIVQYEMNHCVSDKK